LRRQGSGLPDVALLSIPVARVQSLPESTCQQREERHRPACGVASPHAWSYQFRRLEGHLLHLFSQSTSWASRLVGVIGLDTRPYRWSVVDEAGNRRGLFSVQYLARGASLDLDGTNYRMQRSGLLELSFTFTNSGGEQLASAVSRVRGILKRETTVRIADDAFALLVTREHCVLVGTGNRTVGSLDIERGGWTIRQCNGHPRFDGRENSE
jgi:hypothetical protein